jgi:hypothetical protein
MTNDKVLFRNNKEDSMSKKALIVLGLMAFVAALFAQVEVTLLGPQDFEGSWLPTGWTQNPPYTGATANWHQYTPFPGIPAGSNCARCYYEAINDDTLFTPIFDCSGAAYDSIVVVFDEDYDLYTYGAGEAIIYVSSNGGTTWNTAISYGRTEYLDNHRRLRIDTWTGASANARVAFHYACQNDWHWAIDNLSIYAYEPSAEPYPPTFDFVCTPILPLGTTTYTFEVTVNDLTGVLPTSVEVCYTINSDPEVCATMTYITGAPDGTGDYEHQIFGLREWDRIEYYFNATDTYVPSSDGTSSTCVTVIDGNYYVYEDGTGYPMSPSPTWQDISVIGWNTTLWGDDIYGYMIMPFTFRWYGIDSDTIWLSTNGWISFGNNPSYTSWLYYPLPSLIGPTPNIGLWWEDFVTTYTGEIYGYISADNDTLIFQYQAVPRWTDVTETFQVVIVNPAIESHPGNNGSILARYQTVNANTGSIGISNNDGTRGFQYWYDGVMGSPDYLGLVPGRAVRYCSTPPPSGDIYGNVNLVGRVDNSGAQVGVVGLPVYTTTTNPAGDYRLYNVPPGTWDVFCTHPVFYPETTYGVVVVEDESTRVNFTLNPKPIGFVEGYADLTDTPPLGEGGITITELASGEVTTTDASGYFFFDGIPAGNIQIIATRPGYFLTYTPVIALAMGETLAVDTLFLDPADYWYEDFEGDGGGGIVTGGVWQWGVPSSVGPATAHSGTSCWGTIINGTYPTLAYAILEFPIPISPVDTLTYWQYKDMESSFDGGNIHVSTDGGGTWTLVPSPVPPYDGTLSTLFGNPMGDEVAYYGALGWHQVTLDLTSTPGVNRVRFRFGSDNSVAYPGWYIDDILVGDLPFYGGAVEGYVYNCNTYETIGGATVHAGGVTTVSDPSGYFFIDDVPYGTMDIAALLSGYFPGYVYDVQVFIDHTTMVLICMEPLNIDEIEGHLAYGEDDSVYFEICNPTDDTIWFSFALLPYELEDYLVSKDGGVGGATPTDPLALSRRPSGPIKDPVIPTRALGDMWMSYNVDDYHDMAWGLGLGPTQFWVSDPLVYRYNHVYDRPMGNHLGYYDVTGIGGSVWMGDMCYDPNRNCFWQVAVGGSNLIYAFDANTGALIDSLLDPADAWSWTTQRGIAYDPVRDVFYMGSWMTDVIYEVTGPSWVYPGIALSSVPAPGCAGVGWHPHRQTIFYALNSELLHVVYEIDPVTGAVLNTIPTPAPGTYALAGLEVDEWGQVWVVDMNTNEVYVLEGPAAGMYVEPDTFILPGECVTFALINDAWTTPVGDYCFDITYRYTDGTYGLFGTIPTCVQVQPRAYKGWELITVPINATPNNPAIQFADDIVPFVVNPPSSNLYGYNQDAGILELPAGFVRGKGYYLKTWLDFTYWDVYGTEYPAGDFTYTMYYPAASPNWGWWLVGNPYNRRVDWDQVYAYNDFTYLDAEYWHWSQRNGWTWYSPIAGGGGEDQYIDPWRGYFVYVRSGNPAHWVNLTYPQSGTMETFLAKTSGVAKGSRVTTANPAEFALRISAKAVSGSDIRVDKYNYIGVDNDATDGFDLLDVRKPQVSMPGNYIDAHFAEEGLRLAKSAKQNFHSDAKSWTYRVQGIPAGMTVTLDWPINRVPTANDASIGVENMDSRWSLTLVDNATGTTIDMRSVHSYVFTSTTSPRTFTIILSDDALNVPNQELPQVYALGANVPNPFNATTAIEVALPKGGVVKVEVFDMLGKKVNTLVDGEMNAGYHRIVWNGVDNSGREVASGIYLYRVTAGDFSDTKKMTLIK